MDGHQLQTARDYIESYWQTLTISQKNNQGTSIGLPSPYIVPSLGADNFEFKEQYYWDSFFLAIGMRKPEHQEMVEGMLENLLFMQDRFGMIPNASRTYFTGRSQPPMLTSFIFYMYDHFGKDLDWLQPKIKLAEQEYQNVWMSQKHPHWRNVFNGLSRYYDVNVLHDLAEMESGWDLTPRFMGQALDYIPIDLNCILYKNELDFARTAKLSGDPTTESKWLEAAQTRKDTVNHHLWHKDHGFYFDYNFRDNIHSPVWSLAPYFAMWAGLASQEQAQSMAKHLDKFEFEGGLAATSEAYPDLRNQPMQWAYPNGWAPLHYIVYKGLIKYGFNEDAERIKNKWLKTNLDWFNQHGEFLEKYNVVDTNQPPAPGTYPTQSGFGWTNAVFERFCLD